MAKANGKKNPAESKDDGQNPEQSKANLPLFFSKPVLLTTDRHSGSGIRLGLPPVFASETNSIPVTVAEFIEAAKYYPIVFSAEDPIIPVVVTGLEKKNYFMDEEGFWQKNVYIPAYVRKYPFVFVEDQENSKLMLCVDEESTSFVANAEEQNVAKFYDGDQPTEFTRNALNFCAAVQEQHNITRVFCDVLKSMDLLQVNQSEAKLASGKSLRLNGFQVIDLEKLKDLPDEKVLELHRQGWMPLIYYCVLSGGNWKNLLEMAERNSA
jgi:hypothetical protein